MKSNDAVTKAQRRVKRGAIACFIGVPLLMFGGFAAWIGFALLIVGFGLAVSGRLDSR